MTEKLSDEDIRAEIKESIGVDVAGVRSVCLALGPYRNLTTWTAATLFLHPHVQVLNHAGNRILDQPEVDILEDFSPEKLTRFTQYAVQLSGGGRRGDFGGSITHSHAFDEGQPMKAAYEEAGLPEVKEEIQSLFWKESLSINNQIRKRDLSPADLLAADARLRFLQPIRNPLDAAVSNIQTGHYKRLRGLRKVEEPSVNRVVRAILFELKWYADNRAVMPARYFHFFEHSLSRDTFVDLAAFLDLAPDERWLDLAESATEIKPGYDHEPAIVDRYRKLVDQSFDEHPELKAGLLAFVD